MPELPDIELYVARLSERIVGERVERIRFHSPFVQRSVGLSGSDFEGMRVEAVLRLGKRIAIECEGELFIVIHLMIAGRLQWQSPAPPQKRVAGKTLLATFGFTTGQLSLVEFSTRKRAGVWLVRGEEGLNEHRREGIDIFKVAADDFRQRLQSENRTLKRMLTNPHVFDGIGNAYSDEILFEARLSPMRQTRTLDEGESERLLGASRRVLSVWRERLLAQYPKFPRPGDITAFRPDFAVHGKYGQPCPECGSPVQRIVYAENETNYCAQCQNEGRLLADRSLSRLLKEDWPSTLEEMLEERR